MLDATERKALTLSSFVSACITFMPAEIVSGVLLLALSAVLFEYDRRMTQREEAAARAVVPPELPGAGAGGLGAEAGAATAEPPTLTGESPS